LAKYTLEDVISSAEKNNLKCLSTEYNYSAMNFVCPNCNYKKAKKDRTENRYTFNLDVFKKIA